MVTLLFTTSWPSVTEANGKSPSPVLINHESVTALTNGLAEYLIYSA